jgi:hypothetical protein
VKINGKWGFIDRSGKVVIPPQFDTYSGSGFHEDLAKVIINDQKGYRKVTISFATCL